MLVHIYIHIKHVLHTSNVTTCHTNNLQWTLRCTAQISLLGLKDLFPQLQNMLVAHPPLFGIDLAEETSKGSPHPKTG